MRLAKFKNQDLFTKRRYHEKGNCWFIRLPNIGLTFRVVRKGSKPYSGYYYAELITSNKDGSTTTCFKRELNCHDDKEALKRAREVIIERLNDSIEDLEEVDFDENPNVQQSDQDSHGMGEGVGDQT